MVHGSLVVREVREVRKAGDRCPTQPIHFSAMLSIQNFSELLLTPQKPPCEGPLLKQLSVPLTSENEDLGLQ